MVTEIIQLEEVEAWLCPCLTLHHCTDDRDTVPPITLSCPVNMRPLSLTRLGHNCTNTEKADNLLYQMRVEKRNSVPTCLSGDFCLAFTSYSSDESTTKNVMVPIDHIDRPCIISMAASGLTVEILSGAINWLNDEGVPHEEFTTVQEGLRLYLKTLSDKIRGLHLLHSEMDVQYDVATTIHGFIRDRTWPSSDAQLRLLADINEFLYGVVGVGHDVDFWQLCTKARRFIYRYTARQTKVVAHIVEGTHRIAALECALGGYTYSPNENDDQMLIEIYLKSLPHAEKKVNIRAIPVPPNQGGLEDGSFASNMRVISAQAQVSVGKMQPHGKKIFYAIMIEKMRVVCNGAKMKYLLDSDQIDHEHIQQHIKSCAEKIVAIIRDNCEMYHHMVGKMELEKGLQKTSEEWMSLFQKKKTKTKKRKNKAGQEANPTFTYHWDYHRNSIYSIFQNLKDIHKDSRYNMGVPAELFELVQVLLWTRISEECYTRLYRFFDHSNPETKQLSAGSIDKEAKWVTCMISTVGTSVFYSNAVLSKIRKKSASLIPKLIGSAILITTEFFSKRGMDPIKPEWFVSVYEKLENWESYDDVIRICMGILEGRNVDNDDMTSLRNVMLDKVCCQKGLGLPKDYLSFLTLAFALHLQDVIYVPTGGRPIMKISTDLFTEHGEAIIGMQEGINEHPPWTTSIGEFEELMISQDRFSSLTEICLKSSLHMLKKRKRNESEQEGEETPTQLDCPDVQEYNFSYDILCSLKRDQHDPSSFRQWLIRERARLSINTNDQDYKEVCDMLEILQTIDCPVFQSFFAHGNEVE